MRFILLFTLIKTCIAWTNVASIWKEGKLNKLIVPITGVVEKLCVKKNSCIGFYNEKKILVNHNNENMKIKVNNLIDYDVEYSEWNNDIFNIITFYDNNYKVFFKNKVKVEICTPIIRNFIMEIDNVMTGIAVSLDGSIYKMTEDTLKVINLNESCSQVELYNEYLYFVNKENKIIKFCPIKEQIVDTFSTNLETPITHFSVNENNLFIAYDNTVVGPHYKIKTPYKIIKVCTDLYKCMVFLEDTSIICYNIKTGEKWFRVKTNCDLNYFSKFKMSHSAFYVDGTRNELIIYNLVNKDNFDKLLNDFEGWLNK